MPLLPLLSEGEPFLPAHGETPEMAVWAGLSPTPGSGRRLCTLNSLTRTELKTHFVSRRGRTWTVVPAETGLNRSPWPRSCRPPRPSVHPSWRRGWKRRVVTLRPPCAEAVLRAAHTVSCLKLRRLCPECAILSAKPFRPGLEREWLGPGHTANTFVSVGLTPSCLPWRDCSVVRALACGP